MQRATNGSIRATFARTIRIWLLLPGGFRPTVQSICIVLLLDAPLVQLDDVTSRVQQMLIDENDRHMQAIGGHGLSGHEGMDHHPGNGSGLNLSSGLHGWSIAAGGCPSFASFSR